MFLFLCILLSSNSCCFFAISWSNVSLYFCKKVNAPFLVLVFPDCLLTNVNAFPNLFFCSFVNLLLPSLVSPYSVISSL